ANRISFKNKRKNQHDNNCSQKGNCTKFCSEAKNFFCFKTGNAQMCLFKKI
ncbi:MAG: hypothetical protein AVDCRST_MAG96-3011, partial [uncultured Segetibacter sp.]